MCVCVGMCVRFDHTVVLWLLRLKYWQEWSLRLQRTTRRPPPLLKKTPKNGHQTKSLDQFHYQVCYKNYVLANYNYSNSRLAMEHRSVAMAERRAARVARQTAREEERLEALAREEEERTRAEAEARREREATRRAERMAAKQVRGEELYYQLNFCLVNFLVNNGSR